MDGAPPKSQAYYRELGPIQQPQTNLLHLFKVLHAEVSHLQLIGGALLLKPIFHFIGSSALNLN